MSGAEVAAYLGLVDVSIRGISSIHKAASDWKHAPKTIQGLAKESSTLQQTLSELANLQKVDGETVEIAERIGLTKAVTACEDHCTTLEEYISRWTSSTSKYRIKARLHYIFHRSELMGLLADIQTAKQTTILSVLVAQLSLCLKSPMSSQEQQALTAQVNEQIVGVREATSRNSQVATRGDMLNSQQNAQKEAKKQLDMTQASRKRSDGRASEATGNIIQDFDRYEVGGDGNVIGAKIGKNRQVPAGLVNVFANGKTLETAKNNVVGLNLLDD